jgi:hypothetical protein
MKWVTVIDPECGLREYRAQAAGIEFYIWHAIGKCPFRLTAYRPRPNGTNEQVHSGIGIAWYGTRRRCMEQAEVILARDLRTGAHAAQGTDSVS